MSRDASAMRSSKNLWILISGSSLKSKELVGTELQENLSKLSNGLSFYKNSNPMSVKTLKDKKLETKLTTLLLQLSKFMNLDEIQCYDLFCDFLLYDFKGSENFLQSATSDERSLHNLMLRVWDYYRCERLYLLLCIKEVFGHLNNECHPYQELFNDFVNLINKSGTLLKSLLEQWRLLQKDDFSGSKTQASVIVDVQSQTWMLFNLREQCELLQVLFLYCNGNPISDDQFCPLFITFKDHSFGHKQRYKQNSDKNADNILEAISQLECLIIIQCLKLDNITNDDSRPSEYHLTAETESWKEIDTLVSRLGYQKEHGPIMLAWTAVRSHVLIDKDSTVTRRLGKSALESGAFIYLQRILESPIFQGKGVLANCASLVIYDLLASLLLEYDENSLGNSLPLSQICCRLLKNRQLADDFWKRGLNRGVGPLIKSLMSRFPHSFSPFLNVFSGLASASPNSANAVLHTFQTLPSCTFGRDPNIAVQNMYDVDDEGFTLCLLEDYHPLGSDLICLPTGTFGCSSNSKNEALIQWKYTLNGWALCLVIVDHLHQALCASTGHLVSHDLIIQVSNVAEVVKNLLISDPDLISQLFPLLDKLFLFSGRLLDLAEPPLNLLAVTLEAAASLSGKDGFRQTWLKIVTTGILPIHSKLDIVDSSKWGKSDFGHGSIKTLITAHECVSGNYQLTIAFLELICACVDDIAGENDRHYIACVGFIVDEVIPSYNKWWFCDIEQREQIGWRCLDVVNRILGVPFAAASITENWDALRKTVIKSLLYQEAGQSLMSVICIGEETIHRALERQSSWVSGRGLELIQLVKLALSVLNRLLVLCTSDADKNSPTVISLCSQPRAIRIVANYIYHQFDVRLATLSILLMRRFARNLPISLMVCLGSDALPFCKRLILRLESRSEDLHLKVAIIKFLSACVESQPGMTEAFVGTSDGETKSANGCLSLVIQILRQYKEKPSSPSKELRCAALSFLYALWFGRQVVALDALRTIEDLWPVLIEALFNEGLEMNYMAAAYTLGIFAEEYLLSPNQKNLQSFSEILDKELIKKSVIPMWASKTFASLPPSDNDGSNGKAAKNVVAFLKSLRDFLMIGSKVGRLSIPVIQKKTILEGCLGCLISNTKGPQDRTSMIILSETLLQLIDLWHEECRSHLSLWSERSSQLLKTVVTANGMIPTAVNCNILAVCMRVIRLLDPSKGSLDESILNSWMDVASDVLNRCLLDAEKALYEKNENAQQELQVVVLSAGVVQRLTWVCGKGVDCRAWLPELQKRSLLHALINFTVTCLRLHVGLESCFASVELLACLARFDSVCEILVASGLVQNLCLPMLRMPPVYEYGGENVVDHNSKSLNLRNVTWTDVYEIGLRLITSVIRSQRHFVVEAALDFIVIHVDKFQMLPISLYVHFDERLLKSVTGILRYIHELSLFPSFWQLHCDSFSRKLLEFTFTVCYVAVAYLIRPQAILQAIRDLPKGDQPKSSEEMNVQSRLRRISCAEEVDVSNSKLQNVREKLIEVISICMSIMCNFTPDLCELLSDQSYDISRYMPFLEPIFSTPSLEQITPIGFGTILSSAAFCTKMLNLSDRAPSPAKLSSSEISIQNKQMISFLLERSLYLIVSQAGLILSRERESSWDKELFKRELAAELSSCVLSRYVRRSSASVSPVGGKVSMPPSPVSQSSRARLSLEKWPFLNLVISIVDVSFK